MTSDYLQSNSNKKTQKSSSKSEKRREQSSPYYRPETKTDNTSDDTVTYQEANSTSCPTDDYYSLLFSSTSVDDLFDMPPENLIESLVESQRTRSTTDLTKEMKRLLHIANQYAIFFACCEITSITNMHDRISTLPRDPTSRKQVLQRTRAASFLRRNVFRKGKCLGKGAFGSVYLTTTDYSPKQYALKIVKIKVPDKASKDKIDSFIVNQVLASRERDVMITADHPFICKLKASWVEKLHVEGLSYMFLMEYAPFGTLRYFIKGVLHRPMPDSVHSMTDTDLISYIQVNRGNIQGCNAPLDPSTRRKLIYIYTAEMTSALYYLHRLEIVHRDFKPDNVLIGEDYHLRITDFGYTSSQKAHLSFELHEISGTDHLALRRSPLADFDGRSDPLVGALAYSQPPEILLKQVEDTRTFYLLDMWSLGVILFELYGGLHPFVAIFPLDDTSISKKVIHEIKMFQGSRLLSPRLYAAIIDDPFYRAFVSGLICGRKHRFSSSQAMKFISYKVLKVTDVRTEELNKHSLDFMADMLRPLADGTTPGYEKSLWSPYSGVGSPHCEGATALAATFPYWANSP